ncbi:helix-turn-helix transcriptional regulator [Halogeometricum borinquense]|uniref:Bacterial regulatory protein, ArsR family n=2 Tax=Halogeometricum borinquense TaxID=60847 RepID=E4NL18_HALBP|nr:helix-turn-helix domain-containing protein [Halogeometricum borinquense]ADQ67170.1 Bacterial regulatory protein, arsR family [Halogeometricum borinquense DSM 11551]ELY29718.1 bacterial regulatory protein, arsr family [Halogeometricum borinquense DSM 11551]QIB74590.1 helix-turn-helix transcriptional regulator [Halogeometricum borinquense]
MDRWSSEEPDDPALPTVLKSLDDDKCRTILTLLDNPKSASELCEECDLPSSTVYRKLELLRESMLVREYTEVRRDGPNATLYERDFTDISISITDDEFTMAVSRPEEDPEDRLATFWSAMKEESQ